MSFLKARKWFTFLSALLISALFFHKLIAVEQSKQQTQKQNVQISIEDELRDEKSAQEKIPRKKISVEGTDESSLDFLEKPVSPFKTKFHDNEKIQEEFLSRSSQSTGLAKRSFANVEIDGGLYGSFSSNLLFGTRYKRGTHLFEFAHDSANAVGNLSNTIPESSYRHTKITTKSVFSRFISNHSTLKWNIHYKGYSQQLQQKNLAYSSYNKESFFSTAKLTWRNVQDKAEVGISSRFANFRANQVSDKQTAPLKEGKAKFQWNHLWKKSSPNYLTFSVQATYREKNLMQTPSLNYMRAITASLQNQFLLADLQTTKWLFLMGAEGLFSKEEKSQAGGLAKITMKSAQWESALGIQKFFSDKSQSLGNNPFFEPANDSIFEKGIAGFWNNHFFFSRKAQLLLSAKYTMYNDFYTPERQNSGFYRNVLEQVNLLSGKLSFLWQFLSTWEVEISSSIQKADKTLNLFWQNKNEISLKKNIDKWQLSTSVVTKLFPVQNSLPNIFYWNAKMAYYPHVKWNLFLKLQNLLNQNYHEFPPYVSQGFVLRFGTGIML
ncbi:MAG: hypothetical protein D6767_09855 [Candidatus Hydrogenedentota bacterium]|nr:MAG: hypothetical protein D6767_09855 [Candidatus Hydrogenedentota bacterium]